MLYHSIPISPMQPVSSLSRGRTRYPFSNPIAISGPAGFRAGAVQ
jgi:hypothetical protein